jgi:hypothetical protein
MPCYDERSHNSYYDEYSTERKAKERAEAMLCAVLNILETCTVQKSVDPSTSNTAFRNVLGMIDWQEAGVSRKALESWWKEHKELDRQRRIREEKARNAAVGVAAKKAREKAAREAALAKLTEADRKALGLK